MKICAKLLSYSTEYLDIVRHIYKLEFYYSDGLIVEAEYKFDKQFSTFELIEQLKERLNGEIILH